jgi:exopolyphosphatase/guanosine-5'-triphosphate,3'-diphosphate pyrophosphatase
VLLRLAVLLHRGRVDQKLPRFKLAARKRALKLEIPGEWLARNPLTTADLARERRDLHAAGWRFDYE